MSQWVGMLAEQNAADLVRIAVDPLPMEGSEGVTRSSPMQTVLGMAAHFNQPLPRAAALAAKTCCVCGLIGDHSINEPPVNPCEICCVLCCDNCLPMHEWICSTQGAQRIYLLPPPQHLAVTAAQPPVTIRILIAYDWAGRTRVELALFTGWAAMALAAAERGPPPAHTPLGSGVVPAPPTPMDCTASSSYAVHSGPYAPSIMSDTAPPPASVGNDATLCTWLERLAQDEANNPPRAHQGIVRARSLAVTTTRVRARPSSDPELTDSDPPPARSQEEAGSSTLTPPPAPQSASWIEALSSRAQGKRAVDPGRKRKHAAQADTHPPASPHPLLLLGGPSPPCDSQMHSDHLLALHVHDGEVFCDTSSEDGGIPRTPLEHDLHVYRSQTRRAAAHPPGGGNAHHHGPVVETRAQRARALLAPTVPVPAALAALDPAAVPTPSDAPAVRDLALRKTRAQTLIALCPKENLQRVLDMDDSQFRATVAGEGLDSLRDGWATRMAKSPGNSERARCALSKLEKWLEKRHRIVKDIGLSQEEDASYLSYPVLDYHLSLFLQETGAQTSVAIAQRRQALQYLNRQGFLLHIGPLCQLRGSEDARRQVRAKPVAELLWLNHLQHLAADPTQPEIVRMCAGMCSVMALTGLRYVGGTRAGTWCRKGEFILGYTSCYKTTRNFQLNRPFVVFAEGTVGSTAWWGQFSRSQIGVEAQSFVLRDNTSRSGAVRATDRLLPTEMSHARSLRLVRGLLRTNVRVSPTSPPSLPGISDELLARLTWYWFRRLFPALARASGMTPRDVNEIHAWSGSVAQRIHAENLAEAAEQASLPCATLYSAQGLAARVPLIMKWICLHAQRLTPSLGSEGCLSLAARLHFRGFTGSTLLVQSAPVVATAVAPPASALPAPVPTVILDGVVPSDAETGEDI